MNTGCSVAHAWRNLNYITLYMCHYNGLCQSRRRVGQALDPKHLCGTNPPEISRGSVELGKSGAAAKLTLPA
jgi:hypothetical protein